MKPQGFVRSTGPRRATRKDLIERFDKLMKDNKGGIVDFPLRYIEDYALNDSLEPLREKCHGTVTDEELYKGAQLAKVGHLLDMGRRIAIPLTQAEKEALEIQRSSAFWKEPKDLLLTLFACSLASLTQGWDQAANGNLGWPGDFGLNVFSDQPVTHDVWIFGAVQGIMWFSAAILGSYLSDPISEYIGRRGALFMAAMCSFTSVIGASRAQTWQGLLATRIVLGLGIGGKASVVPILESEVTPSSKRGRLLVGWQVFVATGLFCGYTASYILRESWRHQILSGAIPAFALLVATWASCESPRWLIIQGHYSKAFTTLVRLRKERVLAAKELCSIYYQIQAERWLFSAKTVVDQEVESLNPFTPELGRTSYGRRLINHFTFPRIRRAAIATMIVMLSQQLSGINIIALLATNFFSTAGLRRSSEAEAEIDSYKLAIGFAAANSIFSACAYFLVENKEEPRTTEEISSNTSGDEIREESQYDRGEKHYQDKQRSQDNLSKLGEMASEEEPKRFSAADTHVTFQQRHKEIDDRDIENGPTTSVHEGNNYRLEIPIQTPQPRSHNSSIFSVQNDDETDEQSELYEFKDANQMRGRRFLLLISLFGGIITLLITSLFFNIPDGSSARLPLIALFIMIFTLFYSVGAGAIPFLYCAEVFPNEGREIGMSWSTFWNFSGAGLLALFTPFGINWGHGKLLGIFSGFNCLAFILVWFFVPSTNQTATLEDMSYIFGRKMRQHAQAQWKRLVPRSAVKGPRTQWMTAQSDRASVSTVEVSRNRTVVSTGTAAGELMQDSEGAKPSVNNWVGIGKDGVEGKGEGKGSDPDKIEAINGRRNHPF